MSLKVCCPLFIPLDATVTTQCFLAPPWLAVNWFNFVSDEVTQQCVSTGNMADVNKEENRVLKDLLKTISLSEVGIQMPAGNFNLWCSRYCNPVLPLCSLQNSQWYAALELLGGTGGSRADPPLLPMNIIWPPTSKHPIHTNFWVGATWPTHFIWYSSCTGDMVQFPTNFWCTATNFLWKCRSLHKRLTVAEVEISVLKIIESYITIDLILPLQVLRATIIADIATFSKSVVPSTRMVHSPD